MHETTCSWRENARKTEKQTRKQLWSTAAEHGINVTVSPRTFWRGLLYTGLRACRPLEKQKFTKHVTVK